MRQTLVQPGCKRASVLGMCLPQAVAEKPWCFGVMADRSSPGGSPSPGPPEGSINQLQRLTPACGLGDGSERVPRLVSVKMMRVTSQRLGDHQRDVGSSLGAGRSDVLTSASEAVRPGGLPHGVCTH